MKSTLTRMLIAAGLLAVGAACWAEARLTRRVAEAHARLVTLHYDADDGVEDGRSWVTRLPLPLPSLTDETSARRAVVSYWRQDYPSLRTGAAADTVDGARTAADPEQMFVAANAAFRAAQQQAARARQSAERVAAVAVLDGVMQSYAEVLRADPGHADAAYNYEYVIKFRDTVAAGKPRARTAREAADALQLVIPSADLPVGPTIHGRPGAPPPEIPGDQFKTIAPIPFEEREESDPGRGAAPRRRG